MSFLKKVWGSGGTQQQKPTENNTTVMQSMYELEEKKQIPIQKSHEMESIKAVKPPIAPSKPAKGGMFSNMKIKKQNQQKKQETINTSNVNTYQNSVIEQNKVSAYQPPPMFHSTTNNLEESQTQSNSTSFSKNRPQNYIQANDVQIVPTKTAQMIPTKRKKSSNSALDNQMPTRQVSSKKSIHSIAPEKSITQISVVRSSSKSSKGNNQNREQIPVRRKSSVNLDQIKEIQNQMLKSKQRLVQKIKAQKEIKNKIMNESESAILLKQRQNEAIQKQNAAVESQAYDTAAQLQQQLNKLKQQIQIVEFDLEKLQRQFEQAQSNICAEYTRQEQQKAIYKKRLSRAKAQAEKAYDFVMKTQTQKIQLQRGKMDRDKKKLSSIEAQINFNEEKIKEFEHQYQQDLNNQTKLFKEQKNDLSSRRLQINDDIRDLEKRLEQKREELLRLDVQLQQADSNIEEIKRGFENQYRKIVQRKDKLYEMQMERDEFKLGLNQLQTLTESQTQTLESTLRQIKHSIDFIAKQNQQYSAPTESFKDKIQKREDAFSQFLKQTKVLKQYQKTLKVKQDRLKQIQFKKSSLLLEVSLLDGKKKQLKDRIPQLQTEKISLVSSKNFKGAQLKSAQIKQANDQLGLLSVQIQQKYQSQKKLDKLFSEAFESLQTEKQTENQLKKNLAKSQYNLELIRFNDLNSQKLILLRYTQSKQKNELLQFIQSQIDGLREELQFLENEYGLKQQQSPLKEEEKQNIDEDAQEKHEYAKLNQEQDTLNEEYKDESQKHVEKDQKQPQPEAIIQKHENTSEKQSEERLGQQDPNQYSDNQVVQNQKSEQQSIQQVNNQGYQPPTL